MRLLLACLLDQQDVCMVLAIDNPVNAASGCVRGERFSAVVASKNTS